MSQNKKTNRDKLSDLPEIGEEEFEAMMNDGECEEDSNQQNDNGSAKKQSRGPKHSAGKNSSKAGAKNPQKNKAKNGGKASKGGSNNAKSGNKNEQVNADVLMAQAAEQLEAAKAEVAEWKASYTRVYAEWDTYRRRSEEQREADKATATEHLVSDILPVLDDFERTITYARENGEQGLIEGVEAVHNKLIDACCKSGMEVIDPEYGEPFDALRHQAVQTVEDTEVFDESIKSVLQKGCAMGEKVLRPAMVVITTGGEARPKDEDTEEEVAELEND